MHIRKINKQRDGRSPRVVQPGERGASASGEPNNSTATGRAEERLLDANAAPKSKNMLMLLT